jgi:hypothetical protein
MWASTIASPPLGRLCGDTTPRHGLPTGLGKSDRPGGEGGLRKRSHGGNVNPPRNRKSEAGNPPPTPTPTPTPTAGRAAFLPDHGRLDATRSERMKCAGISVV